MDKQVSENNSLSGTELFQDLSNNSNSVNNSTNNSNNSLNNIQACPIINMDDYTSKTGIPCDACANF